MRLMVLFLMLMGVVLVVMIFQRFDIHVGDFSLASINLPFIQSEEQTDNTDGGPDIAGASIVAPYPKVNPVLEVPENPPNPFLPDTEVDEDTSSSETEETSNSFFFLSI